MNSVAQLEQQQRNNKVLIERLRMAERLANNRDFKKLILEEFCVNECATYAQNSANPMYDAEQRADCLGIAQAAGHLRRWLQVVRQMGMTAEGQTEELDEMLVEAREYEDAVAQGKLDLNADAGEPI